MSRYEKKTTRTCIHCHVVFDTRVRRDGVPTTQKYCSESCFVERRKWRRNRAYARTASYRFKKVFGIDISPEEVEKMQTASCEICGRSAGNGTQKDQRNHIDHDHKTSKVRGTLCYKCNHAVGLLNDDPQRCRKVAEYLERASC